MAFLDLFKRKKTKEVQVEEHIEPVELTEQSSINHYVINLCEQMIDMSRDMEDLRKEHEEVTAYFNDISVIEGLEGPDKDVFVDVASNLTKLSKARNQYLNAEHKISDEIFNMMDEAEAELPAIIRRLKENEKYLDAIKHDMNNVETEKVQWSMRRQERVEERARLRSLSQILLFVLGGTAVGVAVLSITLQWGFLPIIVVAFLATLATAYIIIRTQECTRDIRRCDVNQNHAIALENRVKIKYVNIKNAVDYTCTRFRVNNAMELSYNYEQYMDACKEREKFKQTSEDIEYYTGRFIRLLQSLRLYDAKFWVNNAEAFADPRELVEVRHNLLERRQNVRQRLEYNLDAIEKMKTEVEKYVDTMGEKAEQVRTIIQRVDEINKGNA